MLGEHDYSLCPASLPRLLAPAPPRCRASSLVPRLATVAAWLPPPPHYRDFRASEEPVRRVLD